MLSLLFLIAFLLLCLVLALAWLALEVRWLRCGRVSPALAEEVAKSLPEPEFGWTNNARSIGGRTDY